MSIRFRNAVSFSIRNREQARTDFHIELWPKSPFQARPRQGFFVSGHRAGRQLFREEGSQGDRRLRPAVAQVEEAQRESGDESWDYGEVVHDEQTFLHPFEGSGRKDHQQLRRQVQNLMKSADFNFLTFWIFIFVLFCLFFLPRKLFVRMHEIRFVVCSENSKV